MEKSKDSQMKLQQGWIELLSAQQWTFFITLTTEYRLTINAARNAVERFFAKIKWKGVERMFWVAEPFQAKDGYHIHLLVQSTPQLQAKYIFESWQIASGGKRLSLNNRVDIKEFDPLKGASHYVAKHIQSKYSDYDIYDSLNSTLWDK